MSKEDSRLAEFECELERQGKSQNTIETYMRNIRLFIDWYEQTTGEPFQDKISIFDGREYKSYLVANLKQRPTTVNAKLEAVQQYINFLHAQGSHERITIARQKAVPNYTVSVLDKSSLYKCRRWASNHASVRDAAIFEVLLNTGIRVSELTALTLEDIQLSDRKGKLIVRSGKCGKYREIPLNADGRRAVQAYLTVRPKSAERRLFLGERGSIGRGGVLKIVKKIGQKAVGRPDLSPHDLRHTCFTRMTKNGTDLTTIADLAGHANVELTAKYYIATSDEDRVKAVEQLEL